MSAFTFNFDETVITREIDLIIKNQLQFQRAVLIDSQDILLNFIKQLAPRNTGKYADSWKKGKLTGKIAEVTSNQGKLFGILEFTGAKSQLRKRTKGQGPYVFTVSTGETVFSMTINWPGFENLPHVRPATRRLEKHLQAIIAANMSKLSPTLFGDTSNQNKSKVKSLKKKKLSSVSKKSSSSKQQSNRGSKI